MGTSGSTPGNSSRCFRTHLPAGFTCFDPDLRSYLTAHTRIPWCMGFCMRDGEFDDLVIGAGMAGLTTAALLAAQGRRVLVLEAHDTPGGYAHTFKMGEYRFCAQVHYIFNCGEGEPVHELLRQLGLHEEVRFRRLDPEGFDHVVVAGDRYRIPNGLEKYRDRLIRRFPADASPIRRYFETIIAIGRELDVLPRTPSWRDYATRSEERRVGKECRLQRA